MFSLNGDGLIGPDFLESHNRHRDRLTEYIFWPLGKFPSNPEEEIAIYIFLEESEVFSWNFPKPAKTIMPTESRKTTHDKFLGKR